MTGAGVFHSDKLAKASERVVDKTFLNLFASIINTQYPFTRRLARPIFENLIVYFFQYKEASMSLSGAVGSGGVYA